MELPQEMWLKILSYLPSRDLCRVVLVSRHMYNVATDPSLWARHPINKSKLKDTSAVQFLTTQRFQLVKCLDFSLASWMTPSQCTDLLHHLVNDNNNNIADINLYNVNLSKVPPDLLGRAVSSIEKVNLSFTRLTEHQTEAVMRHILMSRKVKAESQPLTF